jgi:hypothetical protein
MAAEHLILAGIFAVLFILPLTWLFVFDRSRANVRPVDGEGRIEPLAPAAPSSRD